MRHARLGGGGAWRRSRGRLGRKRNGGRSPFRRLRRRRWRGHDWLRRRGRIDRRRRRLCGREGLRPRHAAGSRPKLLRRRRIFQRRASVRVDWPLFGIDSLAIGRLRDVFRTGRAGLARRRDARIGARRRHGWTLRGGDQRRRLGRLGLYLFQPEDRADRRRSGERERRNPECPGPGTSSSRRDRSRSDRSNGIRRISSPVSARHRRAPSLSVVAKAPRPTGAVLRRLRRVGQALLRHNLDRRGLDRRRPALWREPRRFDQPHQFSQHFLGVCLLAARGARRAPDSLKIVFCHSYPRGRASCAR